VKRAVLQQVAPLVTSLTVKSWRQVAQSTISDVCSWPLASVLGAVRPHLTSLKLDNCELPCGAVSILARLPRLLSLECREFILEAEAFFSIAQLTQLTSLELPVLGAPRSGPLLLTTLQQLCHLELRQGGWIDDLPDGKPPVLAPAPASFPHMTELVYNSCNRYQVCVRDFT
jgi:hypothetical protein